jgi:hypothetical protein
MMIMRTRKPEAERQKILELLRGHDLTTAASAEAAHDVVLAAYVARIGK